MRLTQNTYTPRYLCSACGLDLQKVMVCREADAPGHWEIVRTLTEVGGLSPQELADEVAKIIDKNDGKWLVQIFVWKNGYVDVALPVLLGDGEE